MADIRGRLTLVQETPDNYFRVRGLIMFMQAQITESQEWDCFETRWEGLVCIPAGEVSPEDIEHEEHETVTGFGARLDAPGYMDCTEWTVYDTAAEAARALLDMYFDRADDEIEDLQAFCVFPCM